MRKLSAGLAEGGTEGKKAAEGLRDLGVITRTSSGELRSTGDIFEQVSASLNRLGITAETRTALVKAFGRSALELIPMLVGLNSNIEKFNSLGLGISEVELKKFKDYQEQIVAVDAAWEQAKRHFKEAIAGTFIINVEGKGAALLEQVLKTTLPRDRSGGATSDSAAGLRLGRIWAALREPGRARSLVLPELLRVPLSAVWLALRPEERPGRWEVARPEACSMHRLPLGFPRIARLILSLRSSVRL